MRDVNAFRASQLLRRMFAIPGDDPAQQLEDVIFPGFELEQPIRARPEHAWARGERIAALVQTAAALAAVNSSVGLRNPSTSSVVITLLGFQSTALQILAARINADPNQVVLAQPQGIIIDGRAWIPSDPTAVPLAVGRVLTAQGNLPLASEFWRWDNTNFPENSRSFPPITLAPGTDLYITNTVINQPLTVAFGWVEREAASRAELGRPAT